MDKELKFRVSGRIARPVGEVYEAVADPAKLSKYFTTGGAVGRMESGATVSWDFADFPGAFPVRVTEAVKDQRIVFRWGGDEYPLGDPRKRSYETTTTMLFEALADGRTLLTISEEGWPDTPAALTTAFGNCEGWTGMLAALKVWVEHGINLREGFYK
jgi:uncharacterized protein YndB with AHSA1/START domain